MGIFDKIKSTLSKGSDKTSAPANFGPNIKKAELGELPPLPEPSEMPEGAAEMPPLEEPQESAEKPEGMEEIQLPPLPEEQPQEMSQPVMQKPAVQKPIMARPSAPPKVLEEPETEEPEEEMGEPAEDKNEKVKPRLFIKVKRYKDLVKKTKDLKLMLDKVNESLSKLEEAKKVEQEKIAECRNIAKKLEDNVKFFKETFTKPVE